MPDKLKAFFRNNSGFLLYSAFGLVFLSVLNLWLWPTPDEYFYATVARSIQAGLDGTLLLSDINTEHVGFVSGISALYNSLFNIDDFAANRIPIFFFGIGITTLFYLIAKALKVPKQQELWMLWILLLVTGFWSYSVRLMLDIPGTFAVILTVYLLLRRKSGWAIGLALTFVMLAKEYYLFLVGPVVLIVSLLDAWKLYDTWKDRIVWFVLYHVGTFVPVALTIVILLDFNFFPYPRLLEAALRDIFGDAFTFFNKAVFKLMGGVIENVQSATNSDTTQIRELSESISDSRYKGEIPTGAIDSENPVQDNGFFMKWWLVYAYNMSETYLNVLVLPLTALGAAISSSKIVKKFKSEYETIRPDIIFMALLLMFTYFNYHQADWMHGFRITIPIIASFIYFSFRAVQFLLTDEKNTKYRFWFLGLSTLSIIGYWITVKDVSYVGALTGSSIFAWLFSIKTYIFITVFAGTALFITFYNRIRWKKKLAVVGMLVIGMFAMKFVPFYFDAKARTNAHAYDYGLSFVSEQLAAIAVNDETIYINSHPYRAQYYSGDPRIDNYHVDPPIRRFTERYKDLYHGGKITVNNLNTIRNQQIDYVLFVNDAKAGDGLEILEKFDEETKIFAEVNRFEVNNEPQWILYKFTYPKPEKNKNEDESEE